DEAVAMVTVGGPQIFSLSTQFDSLEGGADVEITGKNFAPESLVILGDSIVNDFTVVSATKISLRVPPQTLPGKRTLSVLTRGGIVQKEFSIFSKPLSELGSEEITTIAGGVPFVGDGGPAISASLFSPLGITLDGIGNLLICDENNNRVRRVNKSSGLITTI